MGRGVEGSGKGAEVMALNVGGVGGLFTFIIYLHDRLARLVSLVCLANVTPAASGR